MSLYVIGRNNNGQLGLIGNNHQKINTKQQRRRKRRKPRAINYGFFTKLTFNEKAENMNIVDVKCGEEYNIFIDKNLHNNNNNYFICGINKNGECGIGYFSDSITSLTEITYFKENNINIKKVCVSVVASNIFWITDERKLYANGLNQHGQLGIGDRINRNVPTLVDSLENVIDVQNANFYSIALCSDINVNKLQYYLYNMCREIKLLNIDVPNDIFNLIILFYGNNNKVYSTSFSYDGGNGHGKNEWDAVIDCKWHQIESLNDLNIIKIRVGGFHSLFLSSNGTVWCCGNNFYASLGIILPFGDEASEKILMIEMNDIKIQDIVCGSQHNFLIDFDNNIYAFGRNQFGQCGIGDTLEETIVKPTLLKCDEKIRFIKCGDSHSYFCTFNNAHYMFGHNQNYICIKNDEPDIVDNRSNDVRIPYLINKTIRNQFNGKMIKNVYCGEASTILILSNLSR